MDLLVLFGALCGKYTTIKEIFMQPPHCLGQKEQAGYRQLEGQGIPNLGQYMHAKSPQQDDQERESNPAESRGGRLRIQYIKPLLKDFRNQLKHPICIQDYLNLIFK